MQNINGVYLSPVIAEAREYHVFREYYMYFRDEYALMGFEDPGSANWLLNLMPLEKRSGNYTETTQTGQILLGFNHLLSDSENSELSK